VEDNIYFALCELCSNIQFTGYVILPIFLFLIYSLSSGFTLSVSSELMLAAFSLLTTALVSVIAAHVTGGILTCICLMAGVPTAMTSLHDLQTTFFYIMTSQRNNTMRIRRCTTLEYVKRIDATRYIAPCICHTIRHIHGNGVLPLREV